MHRLKPTCALFIVCLFSALLVACGDDDPTSEPPPADEPEPRIRVDVSSLDFGAIDIGESDEQTAEIRNIGDGTLSGEVSLSGSDTYAVTGGGGSFSLGEGATQELRTNIVPGYYDGCVPFDEIGRAWA